MLSAVLSHRVHRNAIECAFFFPPLHFQSAAVRLFTVQLHSSLIFTGIQSSIYILSEDHLHVVFSDACVEMLET